VRIRSIKPEFWRSEDVKRLPREIRLLFIGLWSYVDDNGVGIDDYRRIASDLGPLEDDPVEYREYVRDGLATLSRHCRDISSPPLVARYAVDGKRYLFITGWDHQRVDKPAKARYPRPPEGWTSNNPEPPEGVETSSRDSRDTLAPGTGEQGNRGTDKKASPSSSDVHRPDVEKLCAHLADWMIRNDCKPPTIGKAWRDAARLMLDNDHREFDKALALIDWCQQDGFWRRNIQSMSKFREKYDQLRLAALDEWQRKSRPDGRRHNADDTIRALLAPTGSDGATIHQLPVGGDHS
jgi:hypothetical protein